MKLTVGLTYDLRSEYLAQGYSMEQVGEFDSDETVNALEETLRSLGYRTDRIGHVRTLCGRLAAGDRWDLVFNIAEGLAGRSREAQVPCVLEAYGVGYTMSDPLVCAMTLEKSMAKRLVRDAGLRTPAFEVVVSEADIGAVRLAYPLFAKPVAEGTGKGIDARSRIDDAAGLARVCRDLLARFRQPVLVEEYLPGREFTVGVLGTGADARVLGTMEIIMRAHAGTEIYSFEMKEKCEEYIDYKAAEPGPLRAEIEDLVLRCYRALECRDAGRIDVRIDRHDRPAFIEVNPLPGLHPHHSDLPMIATQEGMSYRDLIGAIIRSACSRLGLPA